MKEFQSKMQSIFPAIPKNSESSVEWENLLKSKWKTQSHLEMSLPARTGVEVAEVSPLENKEDSDWASYWLSALYLEMPVNIQEQGNSNQTKPIHTVLFSMFAVVDSWENEPSKGSSKLDSTGKRTYWRLKETNLD